MAIKEFTTVPKDIREWGRFFRSTRVEADSLATDVVTTASITDDAVTNQKLRNSAALSIIGRPVSSPGDPSDIVAANDGEVIRRSGAVVGFGTLATAGIADNAVSNPKLADMADSTIKGRAVGAGTGDPTDLTAAQVSAILNLDSNVYTPTLANTTNVSASTAFQCQYCRIGSVAIVSGRVSIDPTAAGAVRLDMTLPIASNIGASEDLGGVAFAAGVAGLGAAIRGSATNDGAIFEWVAVDTTNQAFSFVFQYRII